MHATINYVKYGDLGAEYRSFSYSTKRAETDIGFKAFSIESLVPNGATNRHILRHHWFALYSENDIFYNRSHLKSRWMLIDHFCRDNDHFIKYLHESDIESSSSLEFFIVTIYRRIPPPPPSHSSWPEWPSLLPKPWYHWT